MRSRHLSVDSFGFSSIRRSLLKTVLRICDEALFSYLRNLFQPIMGCFFMHCITGQFYSDEIYKFQPALPICVCTFELLIFAFVDCTLPPAFLA